MSAVSPVSTNAITPVVIVGADPCGLAAACELLRLGVPVRALARLRGVVDRSTRVVQVGAALGLVTIEAHGPGGTELIETDWLLDAYGVRSEARQRLRIDFPGERGAGHLPVRRGAGGQGLQSHERPPRPRPERIGGVRAEARRHHLRKSGAHRHRSVPGASPPRRRRGPDPFPGRWTGARPRSHEDWGAVQLRAWFVRSSWSARARTVRCPPPCRSPRTALRRARWGAVRRRYRERAPDVVVRARSVGRRYARDPDQHGRFPSTLANRIGYP